VLGGRVASAQSTASPGETEARAHFEAGRAHARSERWAEALVEFQASEALVPRSVTEFNLAATLLRLGRARETLEMLARLEARPDLDAQLRADVATLRAAARDAVRTLALAVTPSDARLEIDGVVLEGTGSPRAVLLDPGPHTVVITAPGYAERRESLPADAVTLGVELTPLPTLAVVESSEPDAAIEIDGAEVGRGRVEQALAPGVHHVRVSRDGRLPYESDITLARGERVVVHASLTLEPSRPIAEEPLLWVGVGAGVLVLVGVGVAIGLTQQPQPSGGSSGILIAPLVTF
ncbi:MAG: PEGA domain-containing protein, partial [Sandaracinaceae bacterium]|nr:PEGA domain-containing protein [Sandaracinaceae bacterium]